VQVGVLALVDVEQRVVNAARRAAVSGIAVAQRPADAQAAGLDGIRQRIAVGRGRRGDGERR